MLRVPIGQTIPGMKLALDVPHPQRGLCLLTQGFVLGERVIAKLKELGVHEVWVRFPDTEQIRQYISPVVLASQGTVVTQVAELFETLQQDAHAQIDYARYKRSLTDLIEALVAEPIASSYIVEQVGQSESALRHSSEVCFLSLLIGLKLEHHIISQRQRLGAREAHDMVSLGLGAMLHDIGKTMIDPEAVERYERTRDETDPQWKRHVVMGFRWVSGRISPAAAAVVLHHHQNYDGTGFPMKRHTAPLRGLAGDGIHVFARIAAVANAFDRLRRCADGSVAPRVTVLHRMLSQPMASRFDPVVLSALMQVTPAYSPGSIIRLSNGVDAIVVRWNLDHPCRPVVRPIVRSMSGKDRAGFDRATAAVLASAASLTPTRCCALDDLDLTRHPSISIVEQDGHDVSSHNFALDILNEVPVPHAA